MRGPRPLQEVKIIFIIVIIHYLLFKLSLFQEHTVELSRCYRIYDDVIILAMKCVLCILMFCFGFFFQFFFFN